MIHSWSDMAYAVGVIGQRKSCPRTLVVETSGNDTGHVIVRLGVDDEQYRREVLPVLEEFWPVEGDDRVNQTLRDEYADALGRSQKGRSAANIRHHGENVHPLKRNEIL